MNVYVSLTSIFQNQYILSKTLHSLLNQTLKPDKIVLYLSVEPYLVDVGFKDNLITNSELRDTLKGNIDVIFVDNTGPYRKLLPLLKDKWEQDCVIITVDDDTVYHPELVENLVNDYNRYDCVINYRGFTPDIDKIEQLTYEKRNPTIIHKHIFNFPTGKGGILYHPKFFRSTGDLIFRQDMINLSCPTADDVWFMLLRVLNKVECYIDNKPYMTKDNTQTERALCNMFNNNKNTLHISKTLQLLEQSFHQSII